VRPKGLAFWAHAFWDLSLGLSPFLFLQKIFPMKFEKFIVVSITLYHKIKIDFFLNDEYFIKRAK